MLFVLLTSLPLGMEFVNDASSLSGNITIYMENNALKRG